MQTRRLGPLDVSALGPGRMGMSRSYGAHEDAASAATLRRELALGIPLFDTANGYGSDRNEELLGRVPRPHRQAIVLATKVGLVRTCDRSTRNEGPRGGA
jgi:aryl-alcohol dehydrogenase-like predicted oxidoreductase